MKHFLKGDSNTSSEVFVKCCIVGNKGPTSPSGRSACKEMKCMEVDVVFLCLMSDIL